MIFYRPLDRINALTFDLDDTLYDNHPFIVSAEKALRAHLSKHFPQTGVLTHTDWLQIKRELLSGNPKLYSDMSRLRWQTLEAGFARIGFAGQQLLDAVQSSYDLFYYERSNFRVRSQVIEVLVELRKQVPLVAITNGNVNLEQIGLGECFDLCLHASVDNPMKPHRHMFDKARQFLALPAEQILHVGDNLEKDVMGARQAGLKSAWYADNRAMKIAREPVRTLPDVQLSSLRELLSLI